MLAGGMEPPVVKIAVKLTEQQAFAYEVAFIAAIGRWPDGPLANITAGGEGNSGRKLSVAHKAVFTAKGRKHTPEAIEKMRVAARDRPPSRRGHHITPEHKSAISAAAKARGGKPRMKPVSDETREKLSAALKGRRPSEHTIQAVKLANTGRHPSDETRAKLSAASNGHHRNAGRKLSEAEKAHRSTRMKGNQNTKGRKLTPEEIAKRTETWRNNITPEQIAMIGQLRKGKKDSIETINKRLVTRRANASKRAGG